MTVGVAGAPVDVWYVATTLPPSISASTWREMSASTWRPASGVARP